MAFNTGNAVGSSDPRDLYDNAPNLDKLVNGSDPFYPDRLGKLRHSWEGMEQDFENAQAGRTAAFNSSQNEREEEFSSSQASQEARFQNFLVASGYVSKGDYADLPTLNQRNEYVAVPASVTGVDAGYYRPAAGATLPLTITGDWAVDSPNLVLLGDDILRQEIMPIVRRVATFPTTSGMSDQVVPDGHTAFETLGYRNAGDGGGAFFYGPLSANPGTIDSVEVGYGNPATRRWFRIIHKDAVNIDQLGAYGDSKDIFAGGTFRDETSLFIAAINLAASLGLYKITSSGNRGYGLQNGKITSPVEIDLKGSTLFGNFGAHGVSSVDGTAIYWTKRMLYTEAATPVSITFRNFKINGQNSPTIQMAGGEPLIDFRGGASAGNIKVRFLNGEITRGANRLYTTGSGVSTPTLILDYRNMDVLLYNVDEVIIKDVEVRSSPGEMFTIQSDDARTRWFVQRLRVTKQRDGATTRWSSSGLNVLNCSPIGWIRDSVFTTFTKGPVNILSDGAVIEGCTFRDITDSSGLDCCEARSYRQNQIIVRGCHFIDIPGTGIRSSASNIVCDSNVFTRVNICHSFENGMVGDSAKGSWLKTGIAPLYNVRVRNPRYVTFSASHTDLIGIRALGNDAANPIYLDVEGNGLADRPTTRPLYGIHGTHAHLVIRGYHGEGRTAVVYLTGTCKLSADGVVFAPEAGQTVHTVLMENATMAKDSVCIRRSSRITALDSGYSDLRAVTSTVDARALNVEQSPDFAATSNGVVQRDGELVGSLADFNVPSIAAGASTTATVTVTGAVVGDSSRAVFSIDTGGLMMGSRVSAANTVTVTFFNPTTAAIDLGGGTLTTFVRQAR